MLYEDRLIIDLDRQMMNEEQFFQFCRKNDSYRIEREADGHILVMEPTGLMTGHRNSQLIVDLGIWNRTHLKGIVGDSSTGYTLSNNAVRSPDASWISHHRLAPTTLEDREGFVHAVPEFCAEIRSRSDRPRVLRLKMEEYMATGVLLAWYIDVPDQFVEICRPKTRVKRLKGFDRILSGEDVLPGFSFDLKWMK
jgi:Uma2 family endonuclease